MTKRILSTGVRRTAPSWPARRPAPARCRRRVSCSAQDKPSEIIVRAWGGAWGEALQAGVADGFTAETGIPVRLDFTEDNEIKPKIWAASTRAGCRRST